MLKRIGGLLLLALTPLALVALGFAIYVYVGVVQGGKEEAGTISGIGVTAPVKIARDDRGIPHVRAQNEHDLYFAEGYLQGSDRLFQIDVYRRLVSGRLAEIFGSAAASTDAASRTVDVEAIAKAQLAQLAPAQRASLDAFSAGINAAIAARPLPPEFRALAYKPQPWTPLDSLVVSFSTVLALTDSWDDVATRSRVLEALGPQAEAAFFPASDPLYDSPTTGSGHAPVARLPDLTQATFDARPLYLAQVDARAGLGSNNFAAGAAHTRTHRALLANDPHLELHIPGVWWLVDLSCPTLHAAGATLAGVPGVVLGHNAHLAWGATNGTVATVRVFRERFKSADSDEYLSGKTWVKAQRRHETIAVRFGKPIERDYLRTRHGFIFEDDGAIKLAAAWTADEDRRSGLAAFDGLARAKTVAQAQAVLAGYPGPPQNFALADDAGNAGFSLAGEIPIDDAWGMREHDGATSPAGRAPYVAAGVLPHVTGARDALVFTANARTYGAGYPYRLTAGFSPPYRAARIHQLLNQSGPLDVAAFSRIQADVLSLPERDLARATVALVHPKDANDTDVANALAALKHFDGEFTSDSLGATYVVALRYAAIDRIVRYHLPRAIARQYVNAESGEAFEQILRMLRDKPHGWVPHDDYGAFLDASLREAIAALRASKQLGVRWSDAGERTARHPLASLGLSMWNGTRFPGLGDGYSPHVQAPANAQSFRAVWDVGNWEAGGMVIPQGESGEPGSSHYRDAAPIWLAGTLVPLPFDDAAVDKATATTLFISP
jgi:penicillin amidase